MRTRLGRFVPAGVLAVGLVATVAGPPAGGAAARAADTTPPVIDSVGCVCTGPPVTYTGTQFTVAARDDESGIASTTWLFSDGGTGTGSTVGHVIYEPGPFTATVTVTDGAGNASSASTTVEVQRNQMGQEPSFHEPTLDRVRLRPGSISARGLTPGVPRRARLTFRLSDVEFGARVTVVVRGARGVRVRRVLGDDRAGLHRTSLGARFGGVRLPVGRYRVVVRAQNTYGTDTSTVRLRVVR